MEDPLFCSQATTLITTYYMVQIVAHRVFFPVPSALTLSGFQSHKSHHLGERPDFPWHCLSICVNAAKATAEILEQHTLYAKMKNFASMANACYICAGVLLVHIWLMKAVDKLEIAEHEGIKRASRERMSESMTSLQKLMDRLEYVSTRMEISGIWL